MTLPSEQARDVNTADHHSASTEREARPARDAGFSLMEILIALAIIASLTVIVGPRLTGHVDRSKTVSTLSQAKQIKASLGMLQMDIGRYPTQDEGLSLLVEPRGMGDMWRGPYLDGSVPVDAWGEPFQYVPPPADNIYAAPRVYSLGADRAEGGDGLNADIEG
ncbi:MAG: type II secretion system major pseudopilin GspG [Pseudomonadota bacterium]